MNNTKFNRFSDQCTKCSCFYENCDEGEVINPDAECSLEEKTWGSYPCNFFDKIVEKFNWQCMSCKFHAGATICNHWNANDPTHKSVCADYENQNEDKIYDGQCDKRDEMIDRRVENEK